MEREGVRERKEGRARGQSRDLRAGRRGGWRDGALEVRSSGGASECRGVRGWRGGGTQPGLWMSREKGKEALLKCWSFFLSLSLSLRFSSFSWERPPHPPPPPPSLLPPPSCSEAPLVHTLHSPPLLLLFPPPLPLAPSACLPSLLPGGLRQCWRHSRDLQEICLSEKQLVRLSTANVCMLGPPPPPLPLGGGRPGQGTVGTLSPRLPVSSVGRHLALTPLQMTQSSLILLAQLIVQCC